MNNIDLQIHTSCILNDSEYARVSLVAKHERGITEIKHEPIPVASPMHNIDIGSVMSVSRGQCRSVTQADFLYRIKLPDSLKPIFLQSSQSDHQIVVNVKISDITLPTMKYVEFIN